MKHTITWTETREFSADIDLSDQTLYPGPPNSKTGIDTRTALALIRHIEPHTRVERQVAHMKAIISIRPKQPKAKRTK